MKKKKGRPATVKDDNAKRIPLLPAVVTRKQSEADELAPVIDEAVAICGSPREAILKGIRLVVAKGRD